MLVGLESVEEARHVGMVALLEDAHFKLGPSSLVNLALQSFFAHGLDGYQLFAHFMHSQRHFAKGSLTEDPSDSIELTGRGWSCVVIGKVHLHHAFKLIQVFDKSLLLSHLIVRGRSHTPNLRVWSQTRL